MLVPETSLHKIDKDIEGSTTDMAMGELAHCMWNPPPSLVSARIRPAKTSRPPRRKEGPRALVLNMPKCRARPGGWLIWAPHSVNAGDEGNRPYGGNNALGMLATATGYGAAAAHLTPDQNVGRSSLSALKDQLSICDLLVPGC